MTQPGTADLAAIAAIADTVERAVSFRAVIGARGNLPPEWSDPYRDTVATMHRVEGRRRGWIAARLGITPGAVDKLLRPKPSRAQVSA